MLLDAQPGSNLSLEVLEDVASEDTNEDVEAVQVKSARNTNPISDRAIDFWKTFSNWIEAAEKGELNPQKTNFHIRLGRKRSGAICESFASTKSISEARKAISTAREEFFTKKTGKVKKGISGELLSFIEKVFKPSRASLLELLVAHFYISFGTGQAYEELLQKMRTKLIDDELAEDVLLHGLAWVKKNVDSAIEQGLPAVVSVNEFRKDLIAFRDRLRGRDYLPSFASRPTVAEIELQKIRVFVRQLEWVDFPKEHILRAISDFLMAKADRVQYADRGYVHSDSFQEFEDALIAVWMNHRDEIELNKSESEEVRGKRLALTCLREVMRLQGIEVTTAFVRGCFHALADIPMIGWHPDYSALLKKAETK